MSLEVVVCDVATGILEILFQAKLALAKFAVSWEAPAGGWTLGIVRCVVWHVESTWLVTLGLADVVGTGRPLTEYWFINQ